MLRNLILCLLLGGIIGIPPASSDVIINEIMYHPQSNEYDSEYLELYNSSNQSVDLSGWEFTEGINFVFPQGTVIDGHGYLLLCRNEIFLRSFYNLASSIQTVGNFAPSNLSNDGEEIRLYDANGIEADRVEYNDADPWPVEADGDGYSLELVHPNVDNNNVLYWKASQRPTPGFANYTGLQTIPPRFQSVRHFPQSPTSSETVRIEAAFAEDDQINSVSLNYYLNGLVSITAAMRLQGGVYIADVPAQPDGSSVEYMITAVNSSGVVITSPSSQAAGMYLYKVDDHPVNEGAIVINEIMYNNPSADGDDKEWIELFNPSAQAVDASLWSLKDSNDLHVFRLPKNTFIAPNGYLLIAHEKDPGWQAPALEGLPFSLNNSEDAVRLFDPNDRLIASVEYNDGSEWPEGADGEGASLELVQVNRPNGEANNWAASAMGGTPGRANARTISDLEYNDFDVVINELFYHPENEVYGDNLEKEYIEIFNRSDKQVDLSGWRFSDGVEFLFPNGAVIPASGFLIVCKNTALYPDVPNKIGNFILQLNNAGEAVALTNDLGIVIDYVEFNDKFPWPVRPDGDGNSLELIAPYGDNRQPYNWRSGQPASPGAPNVEVLDVEPPRIMEITHTPSYPSASVSEVRTEQKDLVSANQIWRYFEGSEAPPSNWNALDFDASSWEQGQAGFGYGDGDDNTEINMRNSFVSVYIRKTFNLDDADGYETLTLSVDYDDSFVAYLNGVEIARANVSGNPPAWDRTADGNHEAGSAESFDASQFIQYLQPGENVLAMEGHNYSLSSSDFSLNPTLSITRILDAGEDAADSVVITAKVEDAAGISDVQLHYQRCSSPYGMGLVLDDWKSAAMFDDGTGGDAVAGDGIYSFRLNYAETLRPHEVWRYKISAVNAAGQEAIMPLPGEKTETQAFFVEDRLDPPQYPTVYLFAERTVLDWLNRNVDSNDEQPSLVVIDGEVFDLLSAGGIRYRGGDLNNKPKKSWRIRFPKDNRWMGRRVMNLNANYQTSPLLRGEAGFLEHMAFQFIHEMGLPAAKTQAYRVMLNDGYYGLFLGIEEYNEDFLDERSMPADTQIFKAGVKSRISSMTVEPNLEAYAQKYENTIDQEDDIADLASFIEELNSAADLKTFFEANVDIETYLDYLCAIALLSHVDSAEKNYYPVRQADGRWFIMPSNMIHTWGEIHINDEFPLVSDFSLLYGAEEGLFGINQLQRKFLSVPEFRAQYFERLRSLADHIFTNKHLDPILDSYWSYLQDAIEENAQRWNSPGEIDSMLDEIKKYVTARSAFILNDENVRPADAPSQPTNLSPADGALAAARSVNLQAEPPAGQTVAASEWEIQADSDDFAVPYWSAYVENESLSTTTPAYVIASDSTYYWRVRCQNAEGLWSDWSTPTSFNTGSKLALPEVENIVVTPMNGSVLLEWSLPTAADLIRVDIYQPEGLVESTPIGDNRVRIRDLQNGVPYIFTIKTVSSDRRTSSGVAVQAMPMGPLVDGSVIAYYRFEGDAQDSIGLFSNGRLLGSSAFSAPPAFETVPLTQQANTMSLQLDGAIGNGFQFGGNEAYLDVETSVTMECYALFSADASGAAILIDRYDDANASTDGVWRFGVGLSKPGSIDFFFNDGDSTTGYAGRFHAASIGSIAPYDGEFHHYAAVVDLGASSAADKVRLYLDGHPVSTGIVYEDGVSDYSGFRTGSDLPILVGARRSSQAGTEDVVPGRVDEVRISAGVLAPGQFLIGPDITAVLQWSLY
ncbi:MAG: lamin tail domain-containing protein [Candidatus Omnitrophica bacterium]|nr:lamin tail domain-containing protein [Candidatus Omnitrophota bacterium]